MVISINEATLSHVDDHHHKCIERDWSMHHFVLCTIMNCPVISMCGVMNEDDIYFFLNLGCYYTLDCKDIRNTRMHIARVRPTTIIVITCINTLTRHELREHVDIT